MSLKEPDVDLFLGIPNKRLSYRQNRSRRNAEYREPCCATHRVLIGVQNSPLIDIQFFARRNTTQSSRTIVFADQSFTSVQRSSEDLIKFETGVGIVIRGWGTGLGLYAPDESLTSTDL